MNHNKGYELIVEKAEALKPSGYLSAYLRDLYYHDRNLLEVAEKDSPFIWSIREYGTWILTKTEFLNEKNTSEWKRSCYRVFDLFFHPKEKHLAFYFDGNQLIALNSASEGHEVLNNWKMGR